MEKTSRRRLAFGIALTTVSLLAPVAAWARPVDPGVAGAPAAIMICPDPPCPPPTTRTTRPTTTTTRPPNTFNWFIDANSLHVVDNQETFSDEAYIAQIGFRTTPGVPGSTQTWYQGGLSEMGDLDAPETHTIPDAMGRVRFNNVRTRTQAELAAGQRWEIIGTLSLVFESDLTPFSTVNTLMQDLASAARSEIAGAVENLPTAGVSDPTQIGLILAPISEHINTDVSLSLSQKIAIFLGSFGDPDDLVGFKVNFFAALDSSYAPLDNLLGAFVRDETGEAGTLYDRGHALNFNGDGASYTIDFAVSHQ